MDTLELRIQVCRAEDIAAQDVRHTSLLLMLAERKEQALWQKIIKVWKAVCPTMTDFSYITSARMESLPAKLRDDYHAAWLEKSNADFEHRKARKVHQAIKAAFEVFRIREALA